ncbi:hypothetical protein ACFL0F_00820 [Patescibacteria group bacterium]
MTKKILISLLLTTGVLLTPGNVFADNCTTVYGGGVVCGEKVEHKPVETALVDDPALVGTILLGSASALYLFSKRLRYAPSDILK